MLPCGCIEAKAQNAECKNHYYIRSELKYLEYFKTEKCNVEKDIFRAYTEQISVKDMHALADKIRKDGGKVFFAALDE